MIPGVLTDAALTEAAKAVVALVRDHLTPPKRVQRIDSSQSESAIRQHLAALNVWAADISFRDLWKSKTLQESFVNLDLALGAFREDPEDEPRRRVSDLLDIIGHLVLLGDPGAGKTTSLKKTAQSALERMREDERGRSPLLVRLRELPADATLRETVLSALGAIVVFDDEVTENVRAQLQRQIVTRMLDHSCSVLLLDGLDELHHAARESVVADIRELCLRLTKTKLILTCRTGDFRYNIDRTSVFTLRPLSHSQIKQFATRWLGSDRASDFLSRVAANPYSGSELRPLILAHLCAIYERSGTVPDKPKTVYRKIIRLFLEEWDEERSVRRYSKYANFEVDRKEEFLEALAFFIANEYRRASFSGDELRAAYLELHSQFGLPANEAGKVVQEIQSHTGLVVEVAHDEFEFAHKSLQEYLAGSYIAKLPSVPKSKLFVLPNEAAMAVAVSSQPGSYFAALVARLEVDSYQYLAHFSEPFVRRLIIERVDWTASRQLGTAALDLFTKTCYPNARPSTAAAEEDSQEALRSFLAIPAIAQSIAIVINDSHVGETRHGLFFVSDSRRGAARQYDHIVDRKVLTGAKRYIDAARWKGLFGRRQEGR